jgi:DNA replication protein DnaC
MPTRHQRNVKTRKDQAETSALFEPIAEKYERKCLLRTANQPFSGWDNVFLDPGMTVAAIDRLVHDTTIFEPNVESYRRRTATDTRKSAAVNHPLTARTERQPQADH